MARCQDCGSELPLAPELTQGAYIICANCGVELRVARVRPLELELVGEDDVEGRDSESC